MRFRLSQSYDVYIYDEKGVLIDHLTDGYDGKEDMLWYAREAAYSKRKNIGKICVSQRGTDYYAVYTHTGKVIKED